MPEPPPTEPQPSITELLARVRAGRRETVIEPPEYGSLDLGLGSDPRQGLYRQRVGSDGREGIPGAH
jgi:hypothetical protein